jgi:hypothetical protein
MRDEVGKGMVEGIAEGILVYGDVVAEALRETVKSAVGIAVEAVEGLAPAVYNRLAAKESGIVTAAGNETLEGGGVSAADIIPSGRKGGGTPNAPAEDGGGSTPSTGRGGVSELLIRIYVNDQEAGELTADLIDGERKSVVLHYNAGVL